MNCYEQGKYNLKCIMTHGQKSNYISKFIKRGE